jgi:hypothetical protein
MADEAELLRALEGGDTSVLPELASLCRTSGRWRELVQMLVYQAELSPLASEVAEFRCEAAAVAAERLGDLDQALSLYGDVLMIEPDHARAIAGLEALCFGGGSAAARAAELLEPVLLAQGAFAKVAAVLEVQRAATTDEAARERLASRIAAIRHA